MKKFKILNYAVVLRKAKEESDPADQYFSLVKKDDTAHKYKINFFVGLLFQPNFKRNVFAIIAVKYSIMIWKMEEVFDVERKPNTFESQNGQIVTPFVFKYEIRDNEV